MSSYIDVVHPERHAPYLDIPDDVVDYLHYLDFVKLRSPRTVNGYYLDLRGFFRYMMQRWQRVADDTPPEEIDLTGITTDDIRTITKHDIFDFLDHARSSDNGPKAFLTICARKSIGYPRTPRKTSASARRPGPCPNI